MGLLFKIIIVSLKILNFFTNLYISFAKKKGEKKCVPPPKDDLLLISASKLAEMIRTKKVTSEDVIRAYINRIKEVNPLVNAVVDERFDEALKDAKAVSDYLRTTSLNEEELRKIKPMLGVPVTIKQVCMVSGMSSACGAVSRKGMKADNDADAVARLKVAGAIPIAISNTSEFSVGFTCTNNITGLSCNPYDLSRNTGASSGGEGALVGSAASIGGIGSDLAGSVRFPAFCCGVFGHKPSPKTVPNRGHFPLPSDKKFAEYMSIGPLTRYAEDLKLFMTVLSGKQSFEMRLHEKVNLNNLRVYHMEEAPYSIMNPKTQPEIKDCIEASVKYLETSSKSKIMPQCSFDEDFRDIFEIASTLITSIDISDTPDLFKAKGKYYYLEILKGLLGQSDVTSQFTWLSLIMRSGTLFGDKKHFDMRDEIRKKIALELGNDGVLLYPTFHRTAPEHEAVSLETIANVYMMPFNALGLPATTIPCGLSSEGLPLGIQVIAGPNQDRLCFAVAEELEKCFGGWTPTRN